MRILPRTAAAHEAADLYRLRLLIERQIGAPVGFVRWDADATTGYPIAVFGVPADAADRARALGLRVEVA